jgi:hypothetical protein
LHSLIPDLHSSEQSNTRHHMRNCFRIQRWLLT